MTSEEVIKFLEGCKSHCDNEEAINIAISALRTMSATVIRPKMLLHPRDLKKLRCELKEQMEYGIVVANDIYDVIILDERVKEIQADARKNVLDEFRDRLEKHEQENWIEHQEYGITWADIDCVIAQMKGGQNDNT